jgi:hypothetical protein
MSDEHGVAELRKVQKIQFGLLSPDEIVRTSGFVAVAEIFITILCLRLPLFNVACLLPSNVSAVAIYFFCHATTLTFLPTQPLFTPILSYNCKQITLIISRCI